jgi:hypothetical protein
MKISIKNRRMLRSPSLVRTVMAVALSLCAPGFVHAVPPIEETAAVINFGAYAGAFDGVWIRSDHWDGNPATANPCIFYGITCDEPLEEHVISIDMMGADEAGNGLRGKLPPSGLLDSLSELQVLRVGNRYSLGSAWNNQLRGPIPNLSALHKLQKFEASQCGLTGSIPAIQTLTELTDFDVSFNDVTGELPALAGLTKLTTFNTNYNNLSGSIPSLINLPSLQFLEAWENQLTGSIPTLDQVPNLRTLYVATNHLSGSIPSLNNVPNLENFSVSENHLSGPIPDIAALSKLTYFYVEKNQLTGKVPVPPRSLFAKVNAASLCPNQIDISPNANDAAWNIITGLNPWWANGVNGCDDIFHGNFEDNFD